MTHEAVLEFEYSSRDHARRVERAITPERDALADDRSHVTLTRDGCRLEVAVEASDVVALRACLNTWQSLISVAEQAGGVTQASA